MDPREKMAELGPLEWAIVGNGALLLLLFVVLLHMICRLRTLSKRSSVGDPEHGDSLFAPNSPHHPYSTFVALPPKDESPLPPQPIWIPVHYSTLSMPPRRGRCQSCRVASSSHYPHFSSTLPKKKLNVDFAK
ncbi:uncharacterized protein LOC110849226 [Folsomia candida]|uniref:Uncharacterized protein n=1 Tax=Folsomia candida TaxID=158441 RepID=A0A226EHR0_FOLCA|nr:uncharacterized protein LOC110849226 [Folsomia candida]OXA56574.1 hypothetical protein Fcan01_09612 [Folsomia candida]